MSEHPSFISVSRGITGHYAVLMAWNEEGFYEPWNTGFGRYATREEAALEAQQWAEAEELEFKA